MPESDQLENCYLVFTRFNWSDLVSVLYRQNSSVRQVHSHNADVNAYYGKEQWFSVAISAICVFGILGNLLNLFVLANYRITSRLDHIGHSVNSGLKALAVSDMLFCIIVFPHSFITTEFVEAVSGAEAYVLYYRVYAVGLINFCLMTSTWLVVLMACSRYCGIRKPLHAKDQIWTRHMNVLIALVYLFSLLICLPYFVSKCVQPLCRHDGEVWYHLDFLFGETHTWRMHFYLRWIWGIFANFIPTLFLILCNVCLVRELSVVYNQRGEMLQASENRKLHHIVTITLINIVLMSLILVAPSEILRYIDPVARWGETGHTVTLVANLLQTLNFAINFGLYCVVNVHFRTTVKSWLLLVTGLGKPCGCCDHAGLRRSSSIFTASSKRKNGKRPGDRNSGELQSCQTECDTFVLRNSIKKYPAHKQQFVSGQRSVGTLL